MINLLLMSYRQSKDIGAKTKCEGNQTMSMAYLN